jgi:hypothetical protein
MSVDSSIVQQVKKVRRARVVTRAAGLPRDQIARTLLARGIDFRDVQLAETLLNRIGSPFSVKAVVDDTFVPKPQYPTPFPIRRFGDGSAAVYYSALQVKAAKAEIAFHMRGKLEDGLPRDYCLIDCSFRGFVYWLCGHEIKHPQLISQDKSGYPFCQTLANDLRQSSQGLFTPSARLSGGICTPVFLRNALSKETPRYWLRLTLKNGNIHFEKL